MSADARLPRYDVGNYQGTEDCEALWHGPQGSTHKPAHVGTLVHLAREHARKQCVEVPAHLCRPTPAEDMHDKLHPVDQATASGGRVVTVGRFRGMDRAAADAMSDPEWLVPGLLPCGAYVHLIGPPSTFKTFVALDALLSVSTGSREGRMWPVINHPGPTLLSVGEGGSGIKPRCQGWEKTRNGGVRVTNFFQIGAVPWVGNDADLAEFIAVAKALSPDGYRMMALDTGSRAMAGQNINDFAVASNLTKMCERLRSELSMKDTWGCVVMVLLHTGLGAEAQHRAAGSGQLFGDVDTSIVLTREGKTLETNALVTKHKDAPEWDTPRRIGLREVPVSETVKTLVVGPPDGAAPQAKTDAHRDGLATLFALRQVVEAALRSTINGELTASALARVAEERLRDDHQIPVSASRIRNHHLPWLQTTGEGRRWYTARTGKWRWRPAPGEAR